MKFEVKTSFLIYVQPRGERIVFSGPNANTNTIRFQKCGRIRIRILFGFRNMAEYEYEYYSGSEIWPNTNRNTIRSATFIRIRTRVLRLFVYPILPNINTKTIEKQQILKLRTVKIAYWIFCASKHNRKFQMLT